jgi:hypothetical protein
MEETRDRTICAVVRVAASGQECLTARGSVALGGAGTLGLELRPGESPVKQRCEG